MSHLSLVHSAEDSGDFVCIECGYPARTKADLEGHWNDEQHAPQHVQQQRLQASKNNEGWLLSGDQD